MEMGKGGCDYLEESNEAILNLYGRSVSELSETIKKLIELINEKNKQLKELKSQSKGVFNTGSPMDLNFSIRIDKPYQQIVTLDIKDLLIDNSEYSDKTSDQNSIRMSGRANSLMIDQRNPKFDSSIRDDF
jgi:hypothetical protein